MKPKRPTRHPGGELARAEGKSAPIHFNLLQWTNKSIIRAVRMKADELHFERSKDGLTVEIRKGAEVLKTMGPYQRYQDKVIPQLVKMGEKGLPGKYRGQTGGYRAGIDDRIWEIPLYYTRTKSGERMVLRFASSKPLNQGLGLRLMTKGTLLRAVAFKATEVRYEPGKDGLTVKYMRGPRVLKRDEFPLPSGRGVCCSPIADKMIPHLRKLAKMGPADQDGRLVGDYKAADENAVWDFRVTSTATRSGERLVLRPSRMEPNKKPR
jgi:type II secretory ATPase GspE/PulE/Tfp pilus assembly ATPase PilB-like protein